MPKTVVFPSSSGGGDEAPGDELGTAGVQDDPPLIAKWDVFCWWHQDKPPLAF